MKISSGALSQFCYMLDFALVVLMSNCHLHHFKFVLYFVVLNKYVFVYGSLCQLVKKAILFFKWPYPARKMVGGYFCERICSTNFVPSLLIFKLG